MEQRLVLCHSSSEIAETWWQNCKKKTMYSIISNIICINYTYYIFYIYYILYTLYLKDFIVVFHLLLS